MRDIVFILVTVGFFAGGRRVLAAACPYRGHDDSSPYRSRVGATSTRRSDER